MMPRLVRLISERRAKSKSKSKSKSYPTPPPGHAWKRKIANGGQDESSSGVPTTEESARLNYPFDQLGEEEAMMSASTDETLIVEDAEMATWGPVDIHDYGELLEHRLNIGFTLPRFSYP